MNWQDMSLEKSLEEFHSFQVNLLLCQLALLNDNEQGSNDHDDAMVSFLEQEGILDHQDEAQVRNIVVWSVFFHL